jgi:hypothetical protein
MRWAKRLLGNSKTQGHRDPDEAYHRNCDPCIMLESGQGWVRLMTAAESHVRTNIPFPFMLTR